MPKFCYSNNGLSMRRVEEDYNAQPGEQLFDSAQTPEQLSQAFAGYEDAKSNADIKKQIAKLEATITPRRMREAILGNDNGWLESVEQQIAALRAQL